MRKVLYIAVPLVLLAAVVIRLKVNKSVAQQRVYRYDKTKPVSVGADTMRLVLVSATRSFTGSFEPEREAKVSADVQGRIASIHVQEGAFVKKGQPLLQLDDALLRLQLEAVEVQIEGLEADVKRYNVLVSGDAIQGIQLEKAELGLKAARVQRRTLQEQISKTTVRAPFPGVVTAKLSEVGAFAAPGIPLMQVTDITSLRFTVLVPEDQLAMFNLHSSNTVVADAFPGLRLDGTVVMTGSRGNPAGSFPVQMKVLNTSDLKIRSGMFGKVVLNESDDKGIMIPASAIVGSAMKPQVYVVDKGKALLREVVVARRVGNQAVIADGLGESDVVVTGGFINLFDGAPVEVNN